ncbi:MAG: hypothetical protein KF777_06170 [Planctomycetaceae bacterium]|nr:hypothetical protein [Planctomycetaceae bacterium]
MASKKLHFQLTVDGGVMTAMTDCWERFLPGGEPVLNSTVWRGFEARSCGITNLSCPPRSIDDVGPIQVNIEVTYRSPDHVSFVGRTKYIGWNAEVLDRRQDGTLLDGFGQPLAEGQPPVYLQFRMYKDIEFNDLDFGELQTSDLVDEVSHLSEGDVMKELKNGSFKCAVHSTFVASRRHRPPAKIILSSMETGRCHDGCGTEIRNINNKSEHLQQLVTDALLELMCDFIEGRVSISTASNGSATFVQLSSSLVDCAPNEDGLDSIFDILHLETPRDFLDDLARRLKSLYMIDVSVVDGEKGGLLIRHEN